MANLRQILDLARIILFGFGIPEYFHRNLSSEAVFLRPDCLKDIAKASESDWNSNSSIMYKYFSKYLLYSVPSYSNLPGQPLCEYRLITFTIMISTSVLKRNEIFNVTDLCSQNTSL